MNCLLTLWTDEEDDNEEQLPTGKVGTKKLRKLQAKAEKKAMREVEMVINDNVNL